MHDPILSLIIPAYNHTHLLPRLLDSVLNQTLKSMQVIIVDDASDEPCQDVASAYQDKGLSITLLRHERRLFEKKTRLAGIRAARGALIGFADADDLLWGTEALERHALRLYEEGADVLQFRIIDIDHDGKFLRHRPDYDPPAPFLEGHDIFAHYIKIEAAQALWSKLYTRELCRHILPLGDNEYANSQCEDIYLTSCLLFNAKRFIGSEEIGYGYCYSNKIVSAGIERAKGCYDALRFMTEYLHARGCPPETINSYIKMLIKRITIYMGYVCRDIVAREGYAISDARIDRALQATDIRDLVRLLILGNGMNASKILGCQRAIEKFAAWDEFWNSDTHGEV